MVVRDAGTQQYRENWTDATVVTKRRDAQASLASLSAGPPPRRTNWVSIGIWVVVGVAAFGLGGVLTHLRSSGDSSGTVVQASSPVQPALPTPPEATQAAAEPVDTAPVEQQAAPDAAPTQAEPETETLDPSELQQAPKKVAPRVTAKPKPTAATPTAAVTPTAAPKVTKPSKGGIPSEI